MADTAKVKFTVSTLAVCTCSVTVHDPLAGIVKPENVVVPVVPFGAGSVAEMPAQVPPNPVTEYAVAPFDAIGNPTLVNATADGLVNVYVTVAVSPVSTVCVGPDAVVMFADCTLKVCVTSLLGEPFDVTTSVALIVLKPLPTFVACTL